MEFREGMLGVVVVALALTGALFASYLAGIEGEDREYTDYQYLADVSGLFDYDKSPTYIEFDPNSNYTGYYSVNTGEYWPETLVDFVPNVNPTTGEPRVNNYKVNIEPNIISSGVTTPSQLSGYEEAPCEAIFIYNEHDDYEAIVAGRESLNRINSITLSSYISAMNLDSEVNWVDFTSNGSLEEGAINSPANFVIFSVKSQWTVYDDFPFSNIWNLLICSEGYLEENDLKVGGTMSVATGYGDHDLKIQKAFLSASVNLTTKQVYLYYKPDCTGVYKQFSLDEVFFSWGGNDDSTAHTTILLDSSFNYSAQHKVATYLDPNYGVAMKDEA